MQPPLESFIAVMQLTVGSMKTPPCDYANWPSAKPFRNCIKSQGNPALSIPRFFCMCVFKIQRGKQQNGKGEFLLFFFLPRLPANFISALIALFPQGGGGLCGKSKTNERKCHTRTQDNNSNGSNNKDDCTFDTFRPKCDKKGGGKAGKESQSEMSS